MEKPTILMLCSIEDDLSEGMSDQFELIKLFKENDPEATLNRVKDNVRGIIATMRNPVRSNLIEACTNLEIIALASVGYDNVDTKCANDHNIIVTNTPDVVTSDTADTAMSLILNTMRRYVESDAFVRSGQWSAGARKPIGMTLSGKKVGILGLGRIGMSIAKKCEAFDLSVSYCGRNEQDVEYDYYSHLQDMAENVDILVLACPGGEETRHIVDADVLNALGTDGYLINISRGSVVDEDELVRALEGNIIAGAGLDVYQNEPNIPEELKVMDNVVLLPHMGAATRETFYNIDALVVENLTLHFDGKPVKTPLR